jgi:predicted DNA binding CopG/RHH family protein
MPQRSKKKLKPIPKFRSEAEEREFWEEHDSVDYIDWKDASVARFPNLQPSTATISLRLPQGMLDELKVLAHQRDVPYQSLLKVYLADRLHHERRRRRREAAGA